MALKMYILIKDTVDLGHAVLASAHASLGGYLSFTRDVGYSDEVKKSTDIWSRESFRKVVCKVDNFGFEQAKLVAVNNKLAYRVMTESALDNAEVALVFAPREVWPKFFKYLKLYR